MGIVFAFFSNIDEKSIQENMYASIIGYPNAKNKAKQKDKNILTPKLHNIQKLIQNGC